VATLSKPTADLTRTLQLTGGGERLKTSNALTRRAGAHDSLRSPATSSVIVDVREFMSPLPAVLHMRGFTVVPVTLEVGDFVLSSSICVERKAVPDLISSLDSGRLFTQAVAMCKNYDTPVLLIEFDPDKAFALQSTADVSPEIRPHNVASKLVLLLLNFPKLRCGLRVLCDVVI
jgi:DNA excision repair protein ERCC-4